MSIDKEKLIEEMALQFAKKYCKTCGCENCDWAYEFGTKEESCEDYLHYKQMAEHFYNLGYRDCKDKVVLPKEEYEKLQSDIKRLVYQNCNLKIENKNLEENLEIELLKSKETAEKAFNTIIKALEERKDRVKIVYGIAEKVGIDMAISEVKRIAKQLGIEIKE